jgi:hypothetical protein
MQRGGTDATAGRTSGKLWLVGLAMAVVSATGVPEVLESPAARFAALFGDATADTLVDRGEGPAVSAAQPEPRRPPERRGKSWRDYRDDYLLHLAATHGRTEHLAHVHAVLHRFTDRCDLHRRRLDQIGNADLAEYVIARRRDTWRGAPVGPRTINNEIQIIHAALLYASQPGDGLARKRLGLIPRAPWHDLLPVDDLEPVAIDESQFARLMAAAQHATTPTFAGCSPATFWRCAITLTRITLLRRTALLAIPRPAEEVLVGQRMVRLPAAINKTRSDQWVSLGSSVEVAQMFASLPSREGEPLLPWLDRRGRRLSEDTFSAHLRAMQLKAGTPVDECVRLKDLRSTSATEVGDACNATVARRKLKHSPRTNTFETNYQSRKPTTEEVAATDMLLDKCLDAMVAARTVVPPGLIKGVVG